MAPERKDLGPIQTAARATRPRFLEQPGMMAFRPRRSFTVRVRRIADAPASGRKGAVLDRAKTQDGAMVCVRVGFQYRCHGARRRVSCYD